jgi:hypothetical protein
VIGNNDQRSIGWDGLLVFKCISGTEHVGTSHNEPIKDGNASFVRIIPKDLQTKPLYGMKNDQHQSKANEKKYGQRV